MNFTDGVKERVINRFKQSNPDADAAAFDFAANWDKTLGFGENLRNLEKTLGVKLELKSEKIENLPLAELRAQQRRVFVENEQRANQFLVKQFDESFGVERKGEAEALMREISAFSPHSEALTLSTLVAVNQRANVINLSGAGLSKSRSTVELLELLETPFVAMKGHYAPTDFFNTLQNTKSLLVIDESATLLRNKDILNLLLSALWGGKVFWREEMAEINYPIIFNTNSLPNTPFVEALKDRCLFNRLELKTEQIKDKINSKRGYKPDLEAWNSVKANLYRKETLSDTELDAVYRILNASNPKSVRDEGKLLKCAGFCKSMLGDLWYLNHFVKRDEATVLLESDLRRADKVKVLAELKGVSERQARNIISDTETKTEVSETI